MQSTLNRLETQIASRLASRISSSWVCPSCRADLQRKRRFTQQSSRNDSTSLQEARPAQPALPNVGAKTVWSPSEINSLKGLATSGQWRDAERHALQPLQEVLDLGNHIDDALAHGLSLQDSGIVINALLDKQDDPTYFSSFTTATWAEIWRVLNPQRVFIPLHRIHRSVGTKGPHVLGYKYVDARRQYMKSLASLLRVRQQHGPPMDIVDYRTLLTYVARIGDEKSARGLWADMKTDGIQPDQTCYIKYMEAIVWDEEARLKQARKSKDTMPRTRPQFTDIALFRPGVSSEISKLFEEMSAMKVSPDVPTMCVLMTSLARDGEFREATRVLERVWGIDIDAMLQGEEVSDLQRTYPPGSTLHPTPRLFSTVAEVFGLANEVPAGLRVIDYIASQHKMRLPEHTWYQVVRWAWLQARLKPKERRIKTKHGSQISMETVGMIFDVMASEQYNVVPTMDLYNIAFKTLELSPHAFANRFQPKHFLRVLVAGRDIAHASRKNYNAIQDNMRGMKLRHLTVPNVSLRQRQQRELETASLKSKQQGHMLRGWVLQTASLPRAEYGKKDNEIRPRVVPGDIDDWREEGLVNLTEWRLRGFQHFVREWEAWLPDTIDYRTHTGFVKLQLRTNAELEKKRSTQDKAVAEKQRMTRLIRKHSTDKTLYEMRGDWMAKARMKHSRWVNRARAP
jgi:hypothetical protein